MAEQATTTPRSPRPQQGGRQQRGGRRDDRRNQAPEAPKEFEELVLNIDRVSRVVKGGRRFRFKALVVVGNRKDKVGVGVAKGGDVQAAVAKATDVAKKHLVTLPLNGETIPHDSEVKYSGARVLIKPAAPGTGIIAGGAMRAVLEVAGVQNVLAKCYGSTNPVNVVHATFKGLKAMQSPESIAAKRGKSVKEIF